MTGKSVAAVAWFRREDFDRLREISDDAMISSFDEWEAKMTEKIASLSARGVVCKKVVVKPDDLLAFASGRAIDHKLRAEFAAFLLMKDKSAYH